ncbi:MAG: CvpA family protein [Spirochaetales bacterium]|nr:CvpA family protein [Spirochaetales bacterium]
MTFTVVDWVLVGIAAIGGIAAAFNGFFNEIARKLGVIVGIYLGLLFCSPVTGLLVDGTGIKSRLLAVFISYFGVFLIAYLLISFLGNVLSKLFDVLKIGFIDNLLGFFLGIVETVLVLSFFWMLISAQPALSAEFFNDSWIIENILVPVGAVGKGVFGA